MASQSNNTLRPDWGHLALACIAFLSIGFIVGASKASGAPLPVSAVEIVNDTSPAELYEIDSVVDADPNRSTPEYEQGVGRQVVGS